MEIDKIYTNLEKFIFDIKKGNLCLLDFENIIRCPLHYGYYNNGKLCCEDSLKNIKKTHTTVFSGIQKPPYLYICVTKLSVNKDILNICFWGHYFPL